MKHFVYILAVAAFITAEIYADTVATPPVGYTTITIPGNSVKAISIPLDQIPDYQGTVASVNTLAPTTITMSGTTQWTATQFGPFASNPHVIRMLSGASLGRHFQVASNATNTLTLTLPPGITDISKVIAAGDSYELVPVDTLASFFGTGLLTSVLANVNSSLADNVLLRVPLGWLTFYNNGTNWQRVGGDGSSQDNTALMPDSGILFVRQGTGSLSIVVSGQIPVTNLITDVAGATINLFPNRFPTDTTLSALGFQNLATWVQNANPDLADNILIRNSLGWLVYYYDGTNWLRQGGDGTSQNPTISMGTSVLIVHKGSQAISLNQILPYSL